jgi:hypothetical protein
MWCSKHQTLPVGGSHVWHLLCIVHINSILLHITLVIYFQCQRFNRPINLRLCSVSHVNEWVRRTGGMILVGNLKYSKKKVLHCHFGPPQIPHGLTWEWAQASTVRVRWLSSWLLPRGLYVISVSSIHIVLQDKCLAAFCVSISTATFCYIICSSQFIIVFWLCL